LNGVELGVSYDALVVFCGVPSTADDGVVVRYHSSYGYFPRRRGALSVRERL
jgi:hypothetical protein